MPDEAFTVILGVDGLFSRYNFTAWREHAAGCGWPWTPDAPRGLRGLVTGRHEQSSYYTPKPIVSFMGRATQLGIWRTPAPRRNAEALEAFVHEHKPGTCA
ncbi:MAG: class I SAM-dependent DNA methyltransferase, partial [Flavobacteriales bacterium]|nr:class I SAM-dependent DNA methyltransferase [Flavobacteriales bacterium]